MIFYKGVIKGSFGALLRFLPALIQTQGVGKGDGAVLLPHRITVEIALPVGIAGVHPRTRRPGSGRGGGSRALRSRGGFP